MTISKDFLQFFNSKGSSHRISKFKSKLLAAALVVFLAVSLASCFAASSGTENTTDISDGSNKETASEGNDSGNKYEPAVDGYLFNFNGVKISMHSPAAPLLEELGKELAYFEAESCAFQGLDKTYSYPGFDLMTYPIEGTDYISSIVLMDDSVTTPEGLYIGAPESDIISRLGEEYESENGSYVYIRGQSQLMIITEGGSVTSIEYIALTD